MRKLFHRDVWFPGRIKRQVAQLTGSRHLIYSYHAKRACLSDRYGAIPLLQSINLDRVEVVEVEELDGQIVKFVARLPIDNSGRDLVLALIPRQGQLFVKTCWWNMANDKHKTLRVNQYEVPANPG